MFRLKDGLTFDENDPQLLLINCVCTSLDNRFNTVQIQSIMDVILGLEEPSPLERSIYVRPSGQYYISAEIAG